MVIPILNVVIGNSAPPDISLDLIIRFNKDA